MVTANGFKKVICLMTLLCDMSKGPLDKKYQSINFLFHLQTKSSMHLNEAGYWM